MTTRFTTPRTVLPMLLLAALTAVPVAAQNPVLSLAVDDPTPDVGEFVTFTVEAQRDGGNVNNVEVTSLLPAGLVYDSYTASQGTYSPGSGLWDIGRVNGNGVRQLTITAQAVSAGTFTLDADGTNPGGGDHAEASITVGAGQAPISLAQSFEGTVGYVGVGGTFRTANNETDACAVGAASTVTLSGIPSGATVRGAYLYWAGSGDLDADVTFDGTSLTADRTFGDEFEITGGTSPSRFRFFQGFEDVTAAVQAKADPNTTYTLDAFDSESADVTATDPEELYCTYQAVLKSWGLVVVYDDPVAPRRRLNVYDGFAVTREGSVDATITSFETPLANVSAASVLSFEGDPRDDGTNERLTLAPAGGSAAVLDEDDPFSSASRRFDGVESDSTFGVDFDTYDLSAALPAGTTEATLTVGAGLDLVILSATVLSVQTSVVDLDLAMTVDDPAPEAGETVLFLLTVTNRSADTAAGVQVADYLGLTSSLFEVVAITPSRGSFADSLWTVGTLEGGESAGLAVEVRLVADNVAFTNLAEIAHVDQPDIDSTPYNGDTAEDDYASATATTGGSSSGGEGGLESNGTMAQTLANVLYGRRVTEAEVLGRGESLAPPRFAPAGAASRSADLRSIFPEEGPAGSIPFEVSPGDLLPVTNARAVLAADYHRAVDNRRTAVLFATTTAPGEVYEHTKVVCDRLRGAVLEGIERVDILGHPFVLAQLRYPNGSVDYAVSFVAYPTGTGYAVDSRFLLSDYAPEGIDEVVNVQAWSVSRDYTVDLVERVLTGLNGEVVYRNTHAAAPTLPSVFVRRAEYANGRLAVELNNGAAAERIRLSGGTLARVEGGERTRFEETLDLEESEGPVVTTTFETGPVFDVAFFVETDVAGADLLYLADGAWGWAAAPGGASVDAFEVRPDERPATDSAVRRVERPARIEGTVETWATLFRYLRPGGSPVDLTGYEWVEFVASGRGEVQMLLEKASIRTSDHFGHRFTLSPEPRRIRIPFADLRRAGSTDAFTGEDAVVLSFFVWGDQVAVRPFAFEVSDVAFGKGSASDGALPTAPMLAAAYPNPFSDETTIGFELPEAQAVTLAVYDMLGRRVAVLASGEHAAGYHAVRLDGRGLAAGVYLYRLTLPGYSRTHRMTYMH